MPLITDEKIATLEGYQSLKLIFKDLKPTTITCIVGSRDKKNGDYIEVINKLLSQKDDIQYLLENGFKLKKLSLILHGSGAEAGNKILKLCKEIKETEKDSQKQENIFDDDLSQGTIPQDDSLDSGFSADIFEESNTILDVSSTNAVAGTDSGINFDIEERIEVPNEISINKIDSKQSNKGQEKIFDDDLSQGTIPQGDSLDSGFSADIFEESNTTQNASPTNADRICKKTKGYDF